MSKIKEAPLLPDHLIRNCSLLSHRNQLLNHLPKNGKCMEVGVLGGDWSKHILNMTTPSELILVDTFCSNDYAHSNRFTKKNHEEYIKTKFEIFGDKIKVRKGLSWDIMKTLPNDYLRSFSSLR